MKNQVYYFLYLPGCDSELELQMNTFSFQPRDLPHTLATKGAFSIRGWMIDL